MTKTPQKYNYEQLLDNCSFVAWVIHGCSKKSEWHRIVQEQTESKTAFNEAIKTIEALKSSEQSLTSDERLEIWQHINNHKRRKTSLSRIVRYSAAVLLLISLGFSLSILLNTQDSSNLVNLNLPNEIPSKEAQLILEDGSLIKLTDNSKVVYDKKSEQLIVDSDTISVPNEHQSNNKKTENNRAIVPSGTFLQMTLSDGTLVWLNSGSQLVYPRKFGSKREVYLIGEGYFEVKKQVDKPFIVHTSSVKVKVLGTKFNVKAYLNDTHINTTLTEGSVKIIENGTIDLLCQSVVIKPNQQASFSKQENTFTIKKVNVNRHISWTKGMFIFQSEYLEDVLQQVTKFYDYDFYLPKSLQQKHRISGKLNLNDDINSVITVIQDLTPSVKYEIRNNVIKGMKK